jgi:tetratricopeptide (TPR) repeat protein
MNGRSLRLLPRGIRLLSALALAALLFPAAVLAQDKDDALDLYRNGDYQGAIEVCRRELAEMPNRRDAHAVLGWSMIKLRRYEDALAASEEAFKVSRYDPRIIETAGEALFHLGRRSEALRYFEEYAAIAPTGGRIDVVYYYMGEIYIQLGRYNNADIAFSTALYHSPNIADWWARLGYAREKAGELRFSLEAYNKALALNPNLEDAARGRSRVQQQL